MLGPLCGNSDSRIGLIRKNNFRPVQIDFLSRLQIFLLIKVCQAQIKKKKLQNSRAGEQCLHRKKRDVDFVRNVLWAREPRSGAKMVASLGAICNRQMA